MIAFAGLLVISAGATWAVRNSARDAQASLVAAHAHELAVHDALSEIRSGVYLLSLQARDPARDQHHFQELQNRLQANTQALHPLLSGEALKAEAQLAKELDDFGDLLDARQPAEQQSVLTRVDQVQALARRSAEQQRLIEESNRRLRSSLGWIAIVALVAGAGLGMRVMLRMDELERGAEAAQEELRSLAVQLRSVQENERKRLSRELHDEVGQMLTGIRMQLSSLSHSEAAQEAGTAVALERAKTNVEQTLGMVRNIAMLLRPSMLDDLGLTPALEWLVRETNRSSGIEIRTRLNPQADLLPDAHRTCIYRVLQEALNNATKHSGARLIEMELSMGDDVVSAELHDHGRGFDPAAEKQRRPGQRSLGLLGMEERVRELGGQLHIHSEAALGTRVELRLPRPSSRETYETSTDRGRPRHRAGGPKTAV
jgi:signal transduction histidine kinase